MSSISGIVVHGKKRGKQLGYPTANVPLTEKIPQGIYFSIITIDDKKFPSLTFIGDAKTFHEKDVQSETHILNFDEDIYDKTVSVELLEKVRDNKFFSSVDELIKQMDNDKQLAVEFFNKRHSGLDPESRR